MDEVDEEKIDGLVTRLLDEEGARARDFLPYPRLCRTEYHGATFILPPASR